MWGRGGVDRGVEWDGNVLGGLGVVMLEGLFLKKTEPYALCFSLVEGYSPLKEQIILLA